MTQTEKINYGTHHSPVKKEHDVKEEWMAVRAKHEPKNITLRLFTLFVDSMVLNCDWPLGATTLILLNKTTDS